MGLLDNLEIMIMKAMPASKVRKKFGRFLEILQREPVHITKKNHSVAVTMSIQDAEALLQMQTEVGISKGMADIGAGRFSEFTPKYANDLAACFKKQLQSTK